MRFPKPGFIFIALGVTLFLPWSAGRGQGSARAQYQKLRLKLGAESAERHLSLANSLEDKWIYIQALDQFRLAAELAEGSMKWRTSKAYQAMRNLGPALIESNYRYPTKEERIRYRSKAGLLHRKDRKGWKKLADYAAAHSKELLEEALKDYGKLIKDTGDVLAFDKKGRILLPEGAIPKHISDRLGKSEGTTAVNESRFLRNEFFKCIPGVHQVYMRESKNVRIYCKEERDESFEWLDLGDALHSRLKKDFGDSPGQPLSLFVFVDRTTYEAYCRASGNGHYAKLNGFTNLVQRFSMICLEGKGGGELAREDVHALLLHELVHLFHYGTAQIRMPCWFEEGLAESYGGRRAFEWKGGKLKITGDLDRERLGQFLKPGVLMEMDAFLNMDMQRLLAGGADKVLLFYAQSRIFLDYLRNGSGAKTARRFRQWEETCYCRNLDRKGAEDYFHDKFVVSLEKLEKDFGDYLKKTSGSR